MAKELLVGKTSEFEDGGKKIIPNGKSEIGVYLIKGEWFAYQNLCPHQGGPACEGLLMAKVEEIIDPFTFYTKDEHDSDSNGSFDTHIFHNKY